MVCSTGEHYCSIFKYTKNTPTMYSDTQVNDEIVEYFHHMCLIFHGTPSTTLLSQMSISTMQVCLTSSSNGMLSDDLVG